MNATIEHTRAVWAGISHGHLAQYVYPLAWEPDFKRLEALGYIRCHDARIEVLVPLYSLPESAMKPWKEETAA